MPVDNEEIDHLLPHLENLFGEANNQIATYQGNMAELTLVVHQAPEIQQRLRDQQADAHLQADSTCTLQERAFCLQVKGLLRFFRFL